MNKSLYKFLVLFWAAILFIFVLGHIIALGEIRAGKQSALYFMLPPDEALKVASIVLLVLFVLLGGFLYAWLKGNRQWVLALFIVSFFAMGMFPNLLARVNAPYRTDRERVDSDSLME